MTRQDAMKRAMGDVHMCKADEQWVVWSADMYSWTQRGGQTMLMAFELSMPGVASWNGRWTGEGRPYVRVENVTKKWDVKPGCYDYDFGDGWRAIVTVRQVDGATASKLRRQSAGFCGYDWMICEIKEHGRILSLQERQAPNAPIGG